MITIQIQSYGLDPISFAQKLQSVWFEFQSEAYDLINRTREYMISYVNSHKVRPKSGNKLEDSIQVEIINTTGGLEMGIGNIDKIQQIAPYWRILNFGGVSNTGHYVPLGVFIPGEPKPSKQAFRQGQWAVGAGKFTFIAKRPIQGIHYIEESSNFLENNIKDLLNNLISNLEE